MMSMLCSEKTSIKKKRNNSQVKEGGGVGKLKSGNKNEKPLGVSNRDIHHRL